MAPLALRQHAANTLILYTHYETSGQRIARRIHVLHIPALFFRFRRRGCREWVVGIRRVFCTNAQAVIHTTENYRHSMTLSVLIDANFPYLNATVDTHIAKRPALSAFIAKEKVQHSFSYGNFLYRRARKWLSTFI